MSQAFEIRYYNRGKEKIEVEKVYGDQFIKLMYNSFGGKMLTPLLQRKPLSAFYGKLQDTKKSGKKVPPFIKNFNIKIDDYKKGSLSENKIEESYNSFNEFFIREFAQGKRNFSKDKNILGAFAEARYFGYEQITDDLEVPVKGKFLKVEDLIADKELSADFIGGPLMIARLCPVDYHRYHYPDDGKTIKSFNVHGSYHSVNPLALKHKPEIFIQNERRVSILETKNFGKIAYIEVGAMCVGKIVQSQDESKPFKKGEEKGYFLFGGSTVVICGEKGKWQPSMDIVKNTKKGLETYIQLGDEVGVKS